jgi:hypothetical protein
MYVQTHCGNFANSAYSIRILIEKKSNNRIFMLASTGALMDAQMEVTRFSYYAARKAAGCVIDAVDVLMTEHAIEKEQHQWVSLHASSSSSTKSDSRSGDSERPANHNVSPC